jgi:hypothetical protein
MRPMICVAPMGLKVQEVLKVSEFVAWPWRN